MAQPSRQLGKNAAEADKSAPATTLKIRTITFGFDGLREIYPDVESRPSKASAEKETSRYRAVGFGGRYFADLNDERPEALLKSALEKIVYFEARSEQLEREIASARSEGETFKRELASAAQREI